MSVSNKLPLRRAFQTPTSLGPQRSGMRARSLVASDQLQVLLVREVPARAIVIRTGHPVVLDDVLAIHADIVPPAAVGCEPGRRPYLDVGPGAPVVGVAAVLDADGVLVVGPIARMPGHVLVPDALEHRAPVPHHVVGGDVCARVLEPAHGARHGALGDVDEESVYVDVPFAVEARAVVAAVGRTPAGSSVVRSGPSRNVRPNRYVPRGAPHA